jgi:hypothetical protein
MRCPHCPIASALVCLGEDVRRFCALIDPGHAAYDAGYIPTIRAMSLSGREESRAPAIDPRPGVVEALERVQAMRVCPYRSIPDGCGCSGARCALRRGATVSYADCFECLKRFDGATRPMRETITTERHGEHR